MIASAKSFIQKTPGVMGGAACIRNSRIGVWILVGWRLVGHSDERILEGYPQLSQDDLDTAWDYYATNPSEIDAEIELQETDDFESTPESRAREQVLLKLAGYSS